MSMKWVVGPPSSGAQVASSESLKLLFLLWDLGDVLFWFLSFFSHGHSTVTRYETTSSSFPALVGTSPGCS